MTTLTPSQPDPAPAAPPSQIPAQPLPMHIGTAQIPGPDGRIWVALEIATPQGRNLYWLQPDIAVQLGGQLKKLGHANQLVIPT